MSETLEIVVPDIGDFDEVEVVEILVAPGDRIEFDDPLVSVESDKATMEIPSTTAGVVLELRVVEGDRVSEGSVLAVIDALDEGEDVEKASVIQSPGETPDLVVSVDEAPVIDSAGFGGGGSASTAGIEKAAVRVRRELSPAAANPVPDRAGLPHASPLVRRYARELGVPISDTKGSGSHGRVQIEDLKSRIRDQFAENGTSTRGGSAGAIPPMPIFDAAAFGPVREEKLSRIQKVSGPALHRSWLNVPHVTQYDEADVTEVERFRRDRREAAGERGLKLSPLLFVMKAVVIALGEYPAFRASLAPEGDRLFIKEYFHLGIAVDTDQGLVVPVLRDVDRKGIFELAEELNATAERARSRKLSPDDLRGACFTISSLGGIGGTGFSPIVNAPEVAILGLSKTRVLPVWNGPSPIDCFPAADGHSPSSLSLESADSAKESGGSTGETGRFRPRLMLPFSLSYDHRVIDGAEAVRFTSRLAQLFSDPAQLLL